MAALARARISVTRGMTGDSGRAPSRLASSSSTAASARPRAGEDFVVFFFMFHAKSYPGYRALRTPKIIEGGSLDKHLHSTAGRPPASP